MAVINPRSVPGYGAGTSLACIASLIVAVEKLHPHVHPKEVARAMRKAYYDGSSWNQYLGLGGSLHVKFVPRPRQVVGGIDVGHVFVGIDAHYHGGIAGFGKSVYYTLVGDLGSAVLEMDSSFANTADLSGDYHGIAFPALSSRRPLSSVFIKHFGLGALTTTIGIRG